MKFCNAIAASAFGMVVFAAGAAQADQIAFSVASVTQSDWNASDVNLGSVFSIGSAITVTQLGVYDSTYLTKPETVTLYNSGGSALATTTFNNLGGPAQYLFNSITPLTLAPGTYTVSAFTDGNAWAYGVSNAASGIDFLNDDYLYASSAQFPDNCCGSGPDYFGANFQFTSAVPEPITFSIFGAGLAGLTAMRRRKKAKA